MTQSAPHVDGGGGGMPLVSNQLDAAGVEPTTVSLPDTKTLIRSSNQQRGTTLEHTKSMQFLMVSIPYGQFWSRTANGYPEPK